VSLVGPSCGPPAPALDATAALEVEVALEVDVAPPDTAGEVMGTGGGRGGRGVEVGVGGRGLSSSSGSLLVGPHVAMDCCKKAPRLLKLRCTCLDRREEKGVRLADRDGRGKEGAMKFSEGRGNTCFQGA
jgi:hypothetical protein